MYTQFIFAVLPALFLISAALPTAASPLSDPSYGPQPGQSPYYSTYRGTSDAFPANVTHAAILPSESCAPGPDDLLFQNLLAAEWAIYSFYQQGVERFNSSAFTALGLPNTTYDRIAEIRDNEAGHLRIFQNQISNASIKPGACKYDYGFSGPADYLATQTVLEVSSMAFLTGLVLQAKTDTSKAVLVAIAETESRHNAWSLIDVWNTSPFAGPTDTVFPYANQILDVTNEFIIPGSCPEENPPYPTPNQHLPPMDYDSNTTTLEPGSPITFTFPNEKNQPQFEQGKDYYAVAFHALSNFSMPFDTTTKTVTIPAEFEGGRGLILVVIADQMGAPTLKSVVAGPSVLLEQPNLAQLKKKD